MSRRRGARNDRRAKSKEADASVSAPQIRRFEPTRTRHWRGAKAVAACLRWRVPAALVTCLLALAAEGLISH